MSNILLELRKFVAPELVFGSDARFLAGRYASNLGVKRALLVTDPNIISAGWALDVEQSLLDAGIQIHTFSSVSPNPRDSEVMAGAAYYRGNCCDALVAVGGGSVIDCAKGIGIVISNGEGILDYEGIDRVFIPMPPLVCIPTTGGTSADLSQFAIFTNSAEQVKIAVISKAVVPDVALVDPVTLTSMDPYLTACTGMDVLSHAIEAFVSNAASPITDMHALEAMRLVAASLRKSVASPENMDNRGEMMLASMQAGLAFSNASLGTVHSMAHSLGGYKDLPHGECNALLLPHVIDYNFDRIPEKFRKVALALGIPVQGLPDSGLRSALINAVLLLRKDCGIDGTLADRGICIGDVNLLAGKAIKDPCNATNPRVPTKVDIDAVYREAL